MTRPQTAPFCWGQAACFRANAKACTGCAYHIACAQQVLSNLGIINETLNVGDLIVATRAFLDKRGVHTTTADTGAEVKLRFAETVPLRFEVSVLTATALAPLSARARRIALATARAGIDMRADARRGTNSFRAVRFKPFFMADVQDVLNQHKVFTRDMVKQAIAQHHVLKYSTLNNAVSFAMSAMQAMGFIQPIGNDKYALN